MDHLGIVAGTIKDLGLVELIDSHLGHYEDETLSAGETVAGMILNGLGFSNKPLSLTGVIKSAVFDTLRRSFYIIPILFPVPVCTINSQGEHDPGIFRCPPCTGYFQTLLNNVPMRTLYFA
ncbi:MAG: DUF4277 domain-containing protein [Candidatus Electrothrix sp. AW3_4]|nr:DUF4277 domain-containing protein [Candidatus Electrothrix gigas]